MQNDKNINNENEFLKLVYGPPVYFNKMTVAELRAEVKTIHVLLNDMRLRVWIDKNEIEQLQDYLKTYTIRIKLLNKQYSI